MKIEDCYISLGERIKKARKRKHLRQEDLARKMRMSRGSIANIEIGHQRTMIHDVVKFAKVLGTSPKALLQSIL